MAKGAQQVSAREKRLRIESITLRDFRAFPGPDQSKIDLTAGSKRGGNLLLYGENGAGKSSLFEALRGLFTRKPSRKFFRREKNVFSGQPDSDAAVHVTFTDGKAPAVWTIASHPGRGNGDPRVVQTARRAVMLDYRALLDTNYGQGRKEPDLFPIAMDLLLADWPLATGDTLGELWQKTKDARPTIGWDDSNVKAACATFNTEFSAAVDALLPFAREVLKDLMGDAISLDGLNYGTIRYVNAHQRRDRIFEGSELRPRITYRTHGLKQPQFFLNEARQSALALAIYLSARLACTQQTPEDAPKLIVLDDLLIGLDQSNRLPVLDVLMNRFSDWQIILLTHDRVWFDMARMHLKPDTDWATIELYEPNDPSGKWPPVVRPAKTLVAEDVLARARDFFEDNQFAAAANYSRVAFEQALREFCDRRAIRVRYHIESRRLSANELVEGITAWIKDDGKDGVKSENRRKAYSSAVESIKLFQGLVLNPMSHAGSPTVAKAEVAAALAAVGTLIQSLRTP